MRRLGIFVCVVLVVGCSESSSAPPSPYDATRARRVLEPPPGEVRAVPPHAVRIDGIGPYLLGAPVSDVLNLVGPRKVLLQIAGVVDYSVVRAESDTLLVGAVRGRHVEEVSFVSAIHGDTAKTEGGLTIGATADELSSAMGPVVRASEYAKDPRILVFARQPNVRFVVDEGVLIAMAVLNRTPPASLDEVLDAGTDPADPGQPESNAADRSGGARAVCAAQDALGPHAAAVVEASRLDATRASVAYGCFAGSGAEALVIAADQIVLVGGDPDKLRRIATSSVPSDLTFAAALDIDRDGRDEIVLVSRSVQDDEYVAKIELLRVEAGRLVRAASSDVYRITSSAAAANGAELSEIDLLIEVEARASKLIVSGLYVHRVAKRPRTLAPLIEVRVPVSRPRTNPTQDGAGNDAGPADARAKPGTTTVKPPARDRKQDPAGEVAP